MPISFKVDNVEISALRDRVMFNTFAQNQSYVCSGFGQELAVTSSASSFSVSLGTGVAVICGGSVLCEGESPILTLNANESGYLVVEVDLTQTGANICQFKNVASLVQGNINNGSDFVYDLPLYQYTTNASGVSSITDVRKLMNSSQADLETTVNGKAPINHSSTATTYGVATKTRYGHTKLVDNLTANAYADGNALSAYQGKVLDDKISLLNKKLTASVIFETYVGRPVMITSGNAVCYSVGPITFFIFDVIISGDTDEPYPIAHLNLDSNNYKLQTRDVISANVLSNTGAGNPYLKIDGGRIYIGGWNSEYSGIRFQMTWINQIYDEL